MWRWRLEENKMTQESNEGKPKHKGYAYLGKENNSITFNFRIIRTQTCHILKLSYL